ncbi:hypothetical protein MPSEU_000543600 [Mayamaea pseudoterrestris]|nr:hypothetical protein MPSEU_000543600 [Mayamaea pseudoterrestris]
MDTDEKDSNQHSIKLVKQKTSPAMRPMASRTPGAVGLHGMNLLEQSGTVSAADSRIVLTKKHSLDDSQPLPNRKRMHATGESQQNVLVAASMAAETSDASKVHFANGNEIAGLPRKAKAAMDLEQWCKILQYYIDYRNKHGTKVPPPEDYVVGGVKLRGWIRNQRAMYKNGLAGKKPALSVDRYEKLCQIGFYFGPKTELSCRISLTALNGSRTTSVRLLVNGSMYKPELATWIRGQLVTVRLKVGGSDYRIDNEQTLESESHSVNAMDAHHGKIRVKSAGTERLLKAATMDEAISISKTLLGETDCVTSTLTVEAFTNTTYPACHDEEGACMMLGPNEGHDVTNTQPTHTNELYIAPLPHAERFGNHNLEDTLSLLYDDLPDLSYQASANNTPAPPGSSMPRLLRETWLPDNLLQDICPAHEKRGECGFGGKCSRIHIYRPSGQRLTETWNRMDPSATQVASHFDQCLKIIRASDGGNGKAWYTAFYTSASGNKPDDVGRGRCIIFAEGGLAQQSPDGLFWYETKQDALRAGKSAALVVFSKINGRCGAAVNLNCLAVGPIVERLAPPNAGRFSFGKRVHVDDALMAPEPTKPYASATHSEQPARVALAMARPADLPTFGPEWVLSRNEAWCTANSVQCGENRCSCIHLQTNQDSASLSSLFANIKIPLDSVDESIRCLPVKCGDVTWYTAAWREEQTKLVCLANGCGGKVNEQGVWWYCFEFSARDALMSQVYPLLHQVGALTGIE